MSPAWPAPGDVDAYCPPDSYAPVPPASERELAEEAIEDRRASGLPTDRESIRRAVENRRRADYALPGLFFAPEEEAELEAFDNRLAEYAEKLLAEAGAEIGRTAYCWRDGRRMIEITVRHDVDHYLELLVGEMYPADRDRVIVSLARYSQRELTALSERLWAERDELTALGIELSSSGHQDDGLRVGFFSEDQQRAERVLVERHGPMVIPRWLGPASIAEEPCPFGSWIAEGRQLTVFYGLPHNGERPGRCIATEHPDRVIVTLTILTPQGARTEIGGFVRSHATVQLGAPVGNRVVIDGSGNVQRSQSVSTTCTS